MNNNGYMLVTADPDTKEIILTFGEDDFTQYSVSLDLDNSIALAEQLVDQIAALTSRATRGAKPGYL